MFNLDLVIYDFIFKSCKALGTAFGYGAFEGAVIYLGLFIIAGLKVFFKTNNTKKVAKK